MNELPALRDLTGLDARDRLILALNLGVPYPLRALPLEYPPKVDVNQVAAGFIRRAQSGVRYRLCDEDGNAVIGADGKNVDLVVTADPGEAGLPLPTPPVTADITYTALASRLNRPELVVEAYLHSDIPIKVGIDDRLALGFSPADGQSVDGDRVTIPYGTAVRVVVNETQEGVSYQLFTDTIPEQRLSEAVRGDTRGIELLSPPLTEDTPLKVRAFRTATPQIVSTLKARLSVLVRPNPDIAINVTPPVTDFRSPVRVTLRNAQTSAVYHLFRRHLALAEYTATSAEGALSVTTPEGRLVKLQPLPATLNGEQPDGFTLVGAFTAAGPELTIDTDPLAEDTLLVVRAAKSANHETLLTRPAAAALVRPNPAPTVGARQSPIEVATEGFVTVDATQPGVAYQLQIAPTSLPVGLPGFHIGDRGIETMRVEVDLDVGEPGSEQLVLPTGPLTVSTRFSVLAIKTLTGVSQLLTGQATIEVRGSIEAPPVVLPAPGPTITPPPGSLSPAGGVSVGIPPAPANRSVMAAPESGGTPAAPAPVPTPGPTRKPPLRRTRKTDEDVDRRP